MKSNALGKTYRNGRDGRVKERILLIIRVSSDSQHIESVVKELHRSRAWAYKWYKRYNDEGVDGLRDRLRSGKPSEISKEETEKIRKELVDSYTGWDIKQVMDLIQKETGVKYHKEHIRRLLHQWGFSSKIPQKRFVNRTSKQDKDSFKKEYKTL